MKIKNETENVILASSNDETLTQIKLHLRLLHKLERKLEKKQRMWERKFGSSVELPTRNIPAPLQQPSSVILSDKKVDPRPYIYE